MRYKVSVIIRVYDRTEDLDKNLKIISKLWTRHDYEVTVVFNGQSSGYTLSDYTTKTAHKIINLEKNAGHLKGNSQLILEALKNRDSKSDYTILLEADTWLMGDQLIDTYLSKMHASNSVWASSEWVEARWSVGVDFILIKSSFFEEHGKTLFTFETRPEMSICETLLQQKYPFLYIKECMPVHRPSFIKSIYNADGGRVRLFPRAKMLTHHIENLENGMPEKLYLADVCYSKPFFTTTAPFQLYLHHKGYRLLELLMRLTPRSTWFKSKRYTFTQD